MYTSIDYLFLRIFLFQISDSEIVFSQYAQDPYEGFSELCRTEPEQCKTKEKKQKLRRRETSKKQNATKSFVVSRLQRRGLKLIKIAVIDLCNNNGSQTSDSDSENENVVISAQYIVRDAMDSVMDETESLVKKISKSLIDSDF